MSSTRSPIGEVPYDVLSEIFLHCLPRYPLENEQPDTTIAPMLLCQICSSWRAVALASPSLWSHLWYYITTQYVDSEPGSWVFRREEIDFILWWKRNQGSMAPFLRLEIQVDYINQDLSPVTDCLAILLQYVTSAQYLHVESLFWDRLKGKVEFGDTLIFSNLHTLITYEPQFTQVLISVILPRTPSLLRRLAIDGLELAEKPIVTEHWSALTHLTMDNVTIPLNSWFSIIRAVPDLQWAYITFDGIYDTATDTVPPAKYVLPQLSTLFMTYACGQGDDLVFPFTSIFSALYLPALRTLSLTSWVNSWGDHRAISELYTVLQSTPAVTTLTLRGRRFLYLHDVDYPTTLAAIGDIEPIWRHVPHLTHLQLELPAVDDDNEASTEEILDTFVRNIFLSNRSWLALERPACPIKTVTLIDILKPSFHPGFNKISNLTMSSIRKYARGVSNIAFKIISHSEDDTGAAEWKEWDSKVC